MRRVALAGSPIYKIFDVHSISSQAVIPHKQQKELKMKKIFAGTLAALVVASAATYVTSPQQQSDVPVLYWATDANPAREQQIRCYEAWRKQNNLPPCKIMVDAQNADAAKMLIQGVSGVAADILDGCAGDRLRFFSQAGMLEDISTPAREMGFDPSKTWPAIVPDITVRGRQYAFPCNVYNHMLWVNKETFARYGMTPPPQRWTFEEFELIGKEFIEKANAGKPRQTVFFLEAPLFTEWRWSCGFDIFNETGTLCTLDDPRNVDLLKLVWKWMYQDRLMPTSSERSSFNTASGYGGSGLQLFFNGNYGMIFSGRHALIQFRKFGKMQLAVSEPPYQSFPVTMIGTRASAIYAGSKHKDLAANFLAYLASPEYSATIVVDADALPPNPASVNNDAFLRPAEHPNEWGCHEAFARAAEEISIPLTGSPFVPDSTVNRIIQKYHEGFFSGLYFAQEAANGMANEINAEVKRTLSESDSLQVVYRQQLQAQEQIDEARRSGQKIPLSLLTNPFYRHYYGKVKGWVDDNQ